MKASAVSLMFAICDLPPERRTRRMYVAFWKRLRTEKKHVARRDRMEARFNARLYTEFNNVSRIHGAFAESLRIALRPKPRTTRPRRHLRLVSSCQRIAIPVTSSRRRPHLRFV